MKGGKIRPAYQDYGYPPPTPEQLEHEWLSGAEPCLQEAAKRLRGGAAHCKSEAKRTRLLLQAAYLESGKWRYAVAYADRMTDIGGAQ